MRITLPKIFQKKPLDPKRASTVFQTYDEERGYQRYHQYCQSVRTRKIDEKDDVLSKKGLEHVRIYKELDAATSLKTLLSQSEGSIRKENIDYSEMLQVRKTTLLAQIFQKVFSPGIDQKLLKYFSSEYFVYWFAFLRAMPSPKSSRSFLWHCDKGPSRHLKILLYFNGTEEHGGNTEFFDRGLTKRYAETGYLFGPVGARRSDLSDLAHKFSLPYEPKSWPMKAGEAIIFEPSLVLHCGILPTKGPRYVLALCLLPSPVHWHTAFDLTEGLGISQNYNWHTDAKEIQASLESRQSL